MSPGEGTAHAKENDMTIDNENRVQHCVNVMLLHLGDSERRRLEAEDDARLTFSNAEVAEASRRIEIRDRSNVIGQEDDEDALDELDVQDDLGQAFEDLTDWGVDE